MQRILGDGIKPWVCSASVEVCLINKSDFFSISCMCSSAITSVCGSYCLILVLSFVLFLLLQDCLMTLTHCRWCVS